MIFNIQTIKIPDYYKNGHLNLDKVSVFEMLTNRVSVYDTLPDTDVFINNLKFPTYKPCSIENIDQDSMVLKDIEILFNAIPDIIKHEDFTILKLKLHNTIRTESLCDESKVIILELEVIITSDGCVYNYALTHETGYFTIDEVELYKNGKLKETDNIKLSRRHLTSCVFKELAG